MFVERPIFFVTFQGLRLTDRVAGGSFGEQCRPEEDQTAMADRVVIVRAGEYLVSLPFDHIDEILAADRIKSVKDIPEGAVPDNSGDMSWVFSRGKWLPVGILLPGTTISGSSQIVVVSWNDTGKAFAVDQVMGIEAPGEMALFPEKALPYTNVPIVGVRFWKTGPVLELDLSRLISLNLES
jgi:hypothetical protein